MLNLNHKFNNCEQILRKQTYKATDRQIFFDDIWTNVTQIVSNEKYPYVAVLCPYISNEKFLKLLSHKKGCTIVTTREKISDKRKTLFDALTPITNHKVLTLQIGRGRNKSIMHTKAIILLDKHKKPQECLTGSFNFSGGSATNIENVILHKNQEIANIFFNEFTRVSNIATPLKNTTTKRSKKRKR